MLGCDGGGSDRAIEGNQTARLTSERRLELEAKAVSADANAANRLVEHYRYGDPNPLQVEKWLTSAMQSGDKEARVSLGSLLAREHNFYPVTKVSCQRGVALLADAKADGSRAAGEILSDLSPICTKPWLNPYSR